MAKLGEITGKTRVLYSELGEITGETRVLSCVYILEIPILGISQLLQTQAQ